MKNRIFHVLITICSMLLYVPVNRLMTGGYNLEISLDKFIPLIPIFVIPYLFGIIFWIYTIVQINFKQNKEVSKRFNLMIISAGVLSVLIFIIFPTFVHRPEITGTDIFSNILNLVYANDFVYNAAPSGHTFYTILCFFYLNKFAPKQKYLWAVISILIIISTVLTKQHNFIDVIIGMVFALGIYLLNTNTARSIVVK